MHDEEPESDPHGECAAEIHKLQAELNVIRGDWCLGNRESGRGGCGMCRVCCKEAMDLYEAAAIRNAKLVKVAEAALNVLSPCDDSEKERGFCMGHGTITRLPCEFAELAAALDALKK